MSTDPVVIVGLALTPMGAPRRAVGRRIASRIFLDGNTRSEPSWGGSV